MTKTPVHRAYQGESAEDRVRTRKRRLLDVAFTRLATDGAWRTTSIGQLCREAGLNKRYFYESFADLDAVAGAVVDDLATTLLDVGRAAAEEAMAAGMDTPELARYVLDAVVGWLAEDPRRATTLFATGADHSRAITRRNDVIEKLAAGLTAFSLAFHGAGEPLVVAQVGSSMLVGGSIEVILAWLGGRLPVGREELVEDLARLWVAVGDGAIELTKRRAGVSASKPRSRRQPRSRR